MTRLRELPKRELPHLLETAKKKARDYTVQGLFLLILGGLVFLWDIIHDLLVSILLKPITDSTIPERLFLASLLIAQLVCAVLLGYSAKKSKPVISVATHTEGNPTPTLNDKPFFVKFGDFLWRVHPRSGSVGSMPYCLEHKEKLFYAGPAYFCPSCQDSKTKTLDPIIVSTLHRGAESKGEAALARHTELDVL